MRTLRHPHLLPQRRGRACKALRSEWRQKLSTDECHHITPAQHTEDMPAFVVGKQTDLLFLSLLHVQ
jgi:hypothetical protein